MKKNKELVLWAGLVFIAQIIMILLRSNYCMQDPILDILSSLHGMEDELFRFDPLIPIYGKGYDTKGFNALEQNIWLINIVLYCLMVIRKMAQFEEENSYMIIVRYKSFFQYYKMVYQCFIKYTFCYQISLFCGVFVGIKLLELIKFPCSYNMLFFIMAQIYMLMGNLFFGIFLLYFILHKESWKWSILIYPCVPVVSMVFGEEFPRSISNLFPGSWIMLARSNLMTEKGGSFWGILLLESLVFWLMSKKVLKR